MDSFLALSLSLGPTVQSWHPTWGLGETPTLPEQTLTVAGMLGFGSPGSHPLCHRPNGLMSEEGISAVSGLRKPLSQPCSRKQRSVVVSRASVCLVCLDSQIDSQRAGWGALDLLSSRGRRAAARTSLERPHTLPGSCSGDPLACSRPLSWSCLCLSSLLWGERRKCWIN